MTDLEKILEQIAKTARRELIKTIRRGNAPPIDVSPGKGFALCTRLVREALPSKKKRHE